MLLRLNSFKKSTCASDPLDSNNTQPERERNHGSTDIHNRRRNRLTA